MEEYVILTLMFGCGHYIKGLNLTALSKLGRNGEIENIKHVKGWRANSSVCIQVYYIYGNGCLEDVCSLWVFICEIKN